MFIFGFISMLIGVILAIFIGYYNLKNISFCFLLLGILFGIPLAIFICKVFGLYWW